MTDIEERLANAFDTATATVRPEDLRPLTVSTRRSARRWTPAIAALAVAVIVAGAVLVNALRGDEGDPGPLSGNGHYILTVPQLEGKGAGQPAAIHDLDSGQVIQRVPTPSGVGYWKHGAGTADNRTFFLLGSPADGKSGPDRIYRLRIDPRGRLVELARVPGGELPERSASQLAASTDGAKVAVKFDASTGPDQNISQIRIITLSTGRSTTWSASGMAEYLSLSPDGRRLAFLGLGLSNSPDGIRTLDTGSPAGDLIRHSRRLVPVPGPLDEVHQPWLGRDGLYLVSAQAETRLLVVSNTGKVTATLLRRTPPPETGTSGDGPPAASQGEQRPAFYVYCRSADNRHILLPGVGDKLEWFDLQTRKSKTLDHAGNLDGDPVAC